MKILCNEAQQPIAQFIFAHGAGAPMDHEFMQEMTAQLVKNNISVCRFNFPYMQKIVESGKRRPPDKADTLLAHFKQVVISQASPLPLFIGGKSMGGRMSTLVLEECDALGAICFGYPFHPPGKPEKLRTQHLQDITKPVFILQGERDTFGNKTEIPDYPLSRMVQVQYLADGDHSLKPRKSSGFNQSQHISTAAKAAEHFIQEHI